MTAVGTIVRLLLKRLDAELPEQALEMAFSCFDVISARKESQNPGHWTGFETATEIRVRRLLKERLRIMDHEEVRAAVRDFWSAMLELIRLPEAEVTDDRAAWANKKHSGGPALNMLVGFYLAMEDGTVRVEHNHAYCKVLQTAHAGPLSDDGVSFEQLVALKLDGPEAVAEAPSSSTGSSQVPDLQLTDFAREFLREWRQKRARFRVYKQGSRKGRKGSSRANTAAAMKRQQQEALKQRSAPRTAEPDASSASVLPGVSVLAAKRAFSKTVPDDELGPDLKRFKKRTGFIKRNNLAAARQRAFCPSGNPFGKQALKRAQVFTKAADNVSAEMEALRISNLARVKLVDACLSECSLPESAAGDDRGARDWRVRRLFDSDSQGLYTYIAQSHLIVLDNCSDLASKRPGKLLR